MSSTKRRILKELQDLTNETGDNITASLIDDDNIYKWSATISGPSESPYEGGIFSLDINLPENYPIRPPQIIFKTKIFHPNINSSGSICLDILKNQWSPALTIHKTLLSISSLLTDPNPDDPLDATAGKLFKNDYEKFFSTAKEMTLKNAI